MGADGKWHPGIRCCLSPRQDVSDKRWLWPACPLAPPRSWTKGGQSPYLDSYRGAGSQPGLNEMGHGQAAAAVCSPADGKPQASLDSRAPKDSRSRQGGCQQARPRQHLLVLVAEDAPHH